MMNPHRSLILLMGLVSTLGLVSAASQAQTPSFLDVSPDISIVLGGATIRPTEVARDGFGGTPTSIAALGALPDGSDVVGYHEESLSKQLFVLDISANLAGVFAAAGDVIAHDPSTGTYKLELDISSLGVADGVRVDAMDRRQDGSFILSVDVTTLLPGGLVVFDEDLFTYTPGGGFAILLDTSTEGLDTALNLDAAAEQGGKYMLSFDGHGAVGGIDFADEDVLLYDPLGGNWSMMYDGSAAHGGTWEGGDLVAVPEPTNGLLLLAGCAFLLRLAVRTRPSSAPQGSSRSHKWRRTLGCGPVHPARPSETAT